MPEPFQQAKALLGLGMNAEVIEGNAKRRRHSHPMTINRAEARTNIIASRTVPNRQSERKTRAGVLPYCNPAVVLVNH